VLEAVGLWAESLKMFVGLPLTGRIVGGWRSPRSPEGFRRRRARARAAAEAKPDDPKAQAFLADVLSWNKKYAEAIRIYERLVEAGRTIPPSGCGWPR
jgi:hypothetical protein